MSAILTFLLSKAGGWLAMAVALIGTLFVVRQGGKKAQAAVDTAKIDAAQNQIVQIKAAQQTSVAESAQQAAQAQVAAIQEKQDVEQKVAALPADNANSQLLAEFSRDNPGNSSTSKH